MGQRATLDEEIEQLEWLLGSVEVDVDEKSAAIHFDELSRVITDGMNEYLGSLNIGEVHQWKHSEVELKLTDRGFKLLVGQAPWSSVGATSTGLVMLSYNYALCRLTGGIGFHYPGLGLIDFPLSFSDQASGKENFVVEPFVTLCERNKSIQIVVAGRSFRALKGVSRIPFTKVWTQGEPLPDAEDNGDLDVEHPENA